MTEAEWRTCGSRKHMCWALRARPFRPSRWVVFNLACLDRVADLIDDGRCTDYLRELAGFAAAPTGMSDMTAAADPLAVEREAVREAVRDVWGRRSDPLRLARVATFRAVMRARYPTLATSEMVAVASARRLPADARFAHQWDERRSHAELIREVFGNPFRPVAFDPEWRTAAAVALARTMYEARDFAPMPVLADALDDAGCDHPDILGHCRGPGLHVRGCWVVDLVLNES